MKISQKTIMHAAFSNAHILKVEHTIDNPNHITHNQKFYSETVTRKTSEFEYGKPSTKYYFGPKEKMYDSVQELLQEKGIK